MGNKSSVERAGQSTGSWIADTVGVMSLGLRSGQGARDEGRTERSVQPDATEVDDELDQFFRIARRDLNLKAGALTNELAGRLLLLWRDEQMDPKASAPEPSLGSRWIGPCGFGVIGTEITEHEARTTGGVE
jgi:hypothetical protein